MWWEFIWIIWSNHDLIGVEILKLQIESWFLLTADEIMQKKRDTAGYGPYGRMPIEAIGGTEEDNQGAQLRSSSQWTKIQKKKEKSLKSEISFNLSFTFFTLKEKVKWRRQRRECLARFVEISLSLINKYVYLIDKLVLPPIYFSIPF